MESRKYLHHEGKNNKVMKNLITIIALIMFSSFTLSEENKRIITGTIYDESNNTIPGVSINIKGTINGSVSDMNGTYQIEASNQDFLTFSLIGYQTQAIKVNTQNVIDVILRFDEAPLEEVIVAGYASKRVFERKSKSMHSGAVLRSAPVMDMFYNQESDDASYNTEEYDHIKENIFKQAKHAPLSTFSIDVDAASYSNVRRMIMSGQKPYADAVRIEEMINYFSYDYKDPKGEHPFSVNTEVSYAPWNPKHKLVHIGIQGKKLDTETTVKSNLVFLIDVSGSMSAANKLPLLKSSMKVLVNNMSPNDRIAIVAYAGAAGLVLPSTPASEKQTILSALDRLQSGGSTAGGAGIKLAYKVAMDNLVEDGNNRVILATDGDFNTGTSSSSEMVRLIEEKRKSGIYLTITGFGMGNYKDGRMEQISNAGNGNYFYIDSFKEATKVFGTDMQATLFTIAKDVKIQVEFNPNLVQAYRLVGYENRKLNNEDFNNDKVDAGELGAGHTVTALYEIIPTGVESEFIQDISDLKYQKAPSQTVDTNELLTVNIRYKPISSNTSKLISHPVKNKTVSITNSNDNFRFSASVAQFGMILRDSDYKQNANLNNTLTLATNAKGKDELGYRQEFIDIIRSYAAIEGYQFN